MQSQINSLDESGMLPSDGQLTEAMSMSEHFLNETFSKQPGEANSLETALPNKATTQHIGEMSHK